MDDVLVTAVCDRCGASVTLDLTGGWTGPPCSEGDHTVSVMVWRAKGYKRTVWLSSRDPSS